MKIIDARGLSCPEPVILTRQAMASGEASYQVIVDNNTSILNKSRCTAIDNSTENYICIDIQCNAARNY